MAKGKMRTGQEHRAAADAAKDRIDPSRPGQARMRGPEERTAAENLLGEETRASDELLGDDRRSSDELLAAAAEGVQTDLVSDRMADEQTVPGDEDQSGKAGLRGVEEESGGGLEGVETGVDAPSRGLQGAARNASAPNLGMVREGAADTGDVDEGVDVPAGREGASSFGSGRAAADEELGEGEGPTGGEWPDAEALERKEAWEHAPDLEKTAMQLERGEREAASWAAHRPADEAAYDELSNTAYDERGSDEDEEPEARGARLASQERTTRVIPPSETTAIGSDRPLSHGQAVQGRGETEPPPDSVLEVERGEAGGKKKKAPRKRTSPAKKASAMAGDEPERTGGNRRRQSRRAASEQAKGKRPTEEQAPG